MTEFDIIQKYFAPLTPNGRGVMLGTGDDAALLAVEPGSHLVVTTDTLVSGVHYFPDADPADVGYKALAVNLSDLAALGAAPRWFTLALTLSETQITHEWLHGFTHGLAQLARQHGVALVGGDLCQGPPAITIQALGECPVGQEIRRNGAKAGDQVYLSGPLGSAAHALEQLKCDHNPHPDCLTRLLRPTPRVGLGRSLRGIASAMIDLSDGLLADLGHLLKAGNTGARINIDTIPHDPRLDTECTPQQKWRHILSGGDDYELCFTVPPAKLQELEQIDEPLYHVGKITTEKELRCIHKNGKEYIPAGVGYRHF